mmetsp:Transcript_47271/g.86513  ORF Transcript_47271/g.86513 Transcript_47271/m.86513 type:complete len:344 (-) Transcript_47271:296-1327(-)
MAPRASTAAPCTAASSFSRQRMSAGTAQEAFAPSSAKALITAIWTSLQVPGFSKRFTRLGKAGAACAPHRPRASAAVQHTNDLSSTRHSTKTGTAAEQCEASWPSTVAAALRTCSRSSRRCSARDGTRDTAVTPIWPNATTAAWHACGSGSLRHSSMAGKAGAARAPSWPSASAAPTRTKVHSSRRHSVSNGITGAIQIPSCCIAEQAASCAAGLRPRRSSTKEGNAGDAAAPSCPRSLAETARTSPFSDCKLSINGAKATVRSVCSRSPPRQRAARSRRSLSLPPRYLANAGTADAAAVTAPLCTSSCIAVTTSAGRLFSDTHWHQLGKPSTMWASDRGIRT